MPCDVRVSEGSAQMFAMMIGQIGGFTASVALGPEGNVRREGVQQVEKLQAAMPGGMNTLRKLTHEEFAKYTAKWFRQLAEYLENS